MFKDKTKQQFATSLILIVLRFLVKNPSMCAPPYTMPWQIFSLSAFSRAFCDQEQVCNTRLPSLCSRQEEGRNGILGKRINSFATNKMYGKSSGFRSPTMPTKYMMYTLSFYCNRDKKYGI
jgi:hypothetical protein